MSNQIHEIRVSGLIVEVVRKKIKNLHVRVYPPAGNVRVSAPLCVTDEAVRLAIINHLSGIERQREKCGGLEPQPDLKFVSGESLHFQGRRYGLNVVVGHKGPVRVVVRNDSTIDLYAGSSSGSSGGSSGREKIFLKWYRQQLKELVPPLIRKWESIIGEKVADWGVKQMKTRWGTCNIQARRIWLNLELVKMPVDCIEYIVVHEMVPLLERHHNGRFTALMDKFMPDWRLIRDKLNRTVSTN